MNNQTLGLIGIACAPFLFIDTITGGFNPNQHTSLMGWLDLIYMTGWMCSLVALKRMHAFGTGKWRNSVFYLQMLFLCFAQGWNIYAITDAGAGSLLYNFLDVFWPLSNAFMLVTGVTIVFARTIKGWHRFVPLIVGLWLPMGAVYWMAFGRSSTMLIFIGIYSTTAWALMGWSVWLQANCSKRIKPDNKVHKDPTLFAAA